MKMQFDASGVMPETVNEACVAALVSGYAQWRLPEPIEFELLLDAMRFRIAWVGAWMLSKVLLEGWTARVERALSYVQRGYRLAEPTAAFALRCFAKTTAVGNV